jgi:L-threonylcarbamoyladenylate synthase
MQRIVVDPLEPSPEALERGAEALRVGELVAFPTETVYGLGGNALDRAAVALIYATKGRPTTNPLILHVPDREAARRWSGGWPEAAERLAKAFWPGPLTLVLPRHPDIPGEVSGGLSTAAIRVPAHPVALGLLRRVDFPVAAPSANPAGQVSPTMADHVLKGLGDRVALVLDGGATPRGIESTVVSLVGPRPLLLRPGALPVSEIEAVVGPLDRPGGALSLHEAAPSPGMQERHYAPRGEVILMDWDPHERERVAALAREEVTSGGQVGALLLRPLPGVPVHHPIPMPDDPEAYARLLYASLHGLDDLGCDLILVDPPSRDPAWEGVRDRLTRAARGR